MKAQIERYVFIGIDPDVKKSGAAIFIPNLKLEIESFETIDQLKDFITTYWPLEKMDRIRVYIESSPKDTLQGLCLRYYHAVKKHVSNDKAVVQAISKALSSGANMQVAVEVIKFFKTTKAQIIEVPTNKREKMNVPNRTAEVTAEELEESILNFNRTGRKVYPSKLDAQRFKDFFGVQKAGNEDKRDATLLLVNEFISHKYNLNENQ